MTITLPRGGLIRELELMNYWVLEVEIWIFDSFCPSSSEVALNNWCLEEQLCHRLMRERRKIY